MIEQNEGNTEFNKLNCNRIEQTEGSTDFNQLKVTQD